MTSAKRIAVLLCVMLLAHFIVYQSAEAPEIRNYAPDVVTLTLGTSTDVVNDVAAIDAVYYQVTEEDVGADTTLTATESWLVSATLDSGTFPDDMETQDGTGVVYVEVDDDSGALTGDNLLLTPTGVGIWNGWSSQFPATGAHWEKVDDDPPHDTDTTYIIMTTGANGLDTYQLEDIIAFGAPGLKESGTITTFSWSRAETVVGPTYTNNTIYTYSTRYDEGQESPIITYTNNTWVMATNPNTGLEWTLTEINAMEVGVHGESPIPEFEVIRCTSVGVVVPIQNINYVLDVRHNITSVPAGRENYLLTMRAHTNPGEDITVSVYDHVTLGWDTMFTITNTTYDTRTFGLIEADHINAGEVWIRSVDVAGDGVASDYFNIDLLNIRAWDISYTLEVQFNWLSLAPTDKSSRLTVVGYRTAGETMTLEVLRTGAWFTLDAAVLDVAPSASYVYELAPADLAAGTLQIRFTDNDPADDVQSTIYLDFLNLRLEEEEHGPSAPIDVYVAVSYDLWANEFIVKVWWVQTGGPEPAEEVSKWVTLEVDGQLLGTYEVNGALRVEAPWSYFDGGSHNVSAVGAVVVNWSWIPATQTYFSDPDLSYAANFARLAAMLFLLVCAFAAIAAVVVSAVTKKGNDDED